MRRHILHTGISTIFVLIIMFSLCIGVDVNAAVYSDTQLQTDVKVNDSESELQAVRDRNVLIKYREYNKRFDKIETLDDLQENNYKVYDNQTFMYHMESFGEESVYIVPAMDRTFHRIAIFIADEEGNILYKTDKLATNNLILGQMEQPVAGLASIAFADVDRDGLSDIILITECENDEYYEGNTYKTGDVLFQGDKCFYRDYRISDKINRFGMNRSANCIISYVRDGQSLEYLYTASTLEELVENGFNIYEEQTFTRNFEKLGKIKVVPGRARISQFDILMVFLINEQGKIVWSFQPMGNYDNLYALKGVSSGRDIDGDGLKDIVILAKYSYDGSTGEMMIESKCSIYYQRISGFEEDTEFEKTYQCDEKDTMEQMIKYIRKYWGWKVEND